MSKIGVFVDTSDLYHKIQRKFRGKLCFDSYYEKCESMGTIVKAMAYGLRISDETSGFINCLKIAGFEPKFKKPKIRTLGEHKLRFCNWDCVLTLDIVHLINRLDVVVIGSSNTDIIPLIKWIRDEGVRVVILASCVPKVFREIADEVIEITEDELEKEEDDVRES